MSITIDDNLNYVSYTASASQTNFTFPFDFYDKNDILVYQTLASETPSDQADLLTINNDYTITETPPAKGGTVVLNTGASVNDVIVIVNNIGLNRDTNFINSLDADQINDQFNKIILMVQRLNMELTNRGLKYQNTDQIDVSTPLTQNIMPVLANKTTGKIPILSTNTSGGLIATEIDEDDEASTLRSDLAANTVSNSGASLVGYYDPLSGTPTDVKSEIDSLNSSLVGASFVTGMWMGYWGTTAPTGWILAIEGTIGNASSSATIRANNDCEDLFKLYWNSCADAQATVVGGRGASADADWSANKQIVIPKIPGRVIACAGQATLTAVFTTDYMADNELFTIPSSATSLVFLENIAYGTRVRLTTTGTLPTGVATGTDYYITGISSNTVKLASSPLNANQETYLTISSDGSGTHTIEIQFTNYVNGYIFGEEKHMMLEAETSPHIHNYTTFDNQTILLSASSGSETWQASVTSTTGNGSSNNVIANPHNIIQPVVFSNMVIKL